MTATRRTRPGTGFPKIKPERPDPGPSKHAAIAERLQLAAAGRGLKNAATRLRAAKEAWKIWQDWQRPRAPRPTHTARLLRYMLVESERLKAVMRPDEKSDKPDARQRKAARNLLLLYQAIYGLLSAKGLPSSDVPLAYDARLRQIYDLGGFTSWADVSLVPRGSERKRAIKKARAIANRLRLLCK